MMKQQNCQLRFVGIIVFLFVGCIINKTVQAADVLQLTKENYEKATAGKTVFIMFYAPWCLHSKKLAPTWEQLAADWTFSKVGLVAKVDCTDKAVNGGKELCDDHNVNSFPTLRYGDPIMTTTTTKYSSSSRSNSRRTTTAKTKLMTYEGGRSLIDLSKFAKENLKPLCSPSHLDQCDEGTKKELTFLLQHSDDEINKLLQAEKQKLKEEKKKFQVRVKELKDSYDRLSEEKQTKIDQVKASGLGTAKTIKAYKKSMEEKKRQASRSDEL